MKKLIYLSISLLLFTSSAFAQNSTNILISSVQKELNRSFKELNSAEYPPYFISYQVIEKIGHRITAKFGKVLNSAATHSRQLDVDLRVGSHKLDNTHQIRGHVDFGGGITTVALPLVDNEVVIRNAVWVATDQSYKNGIEKLEKAKANEEIKVAAEDTSADFSAEKPNNYNERFRNIKYYNEMTRIFIDPALAIALDTNKWINTLKELSDKFSANTWLLDGNITFSVEIVNKLFINTEGTEVSVSEPAIRLMISAKCKADDGMMLPLFKGYFGFQPTDIPPKDSISKDIDKLIETLDSLRKSELAVTFTGPALLSGEASGVFFHEIFGHRVEGFREKDADSPNMFKQMIGQKVLPEFMDVYFDPTAQNHNNIKLAGYYKYDDEGMLGKRVDVVDNGVFKNFLMSRSPIEGFLNTNGHGRKAAGRSVVTRQSNLIVSSEKTHSAEQMRNLLIEEAKKQGKEYGLYFETVSGGFTFVTRYVPNAFNVTPLVVYKIYVDGRPDELVRGVDIIGTPLTTFSKITATGSDFGVFNGVCGAESGWVPVSACSPTILVSQIEVQKKVKSQSKPPILGSPLNETPAK